jgi:hypothetical protein
MIAAPASGASGKVVAGAFFLLRWLLHAMRRPGRRPAPISPWAKRPTGASRPLLHPPLCLQPGPDTGRREGHLARRRRPRWLWPPRAAPRPPRRAERRLLGAIDQHGLDLRNLGKGQNGIHRPAEARDAGPVERHRFLQDSADRLNDMLPHSSRIDDQSAILRDHHSGDANVPGDAVHCDFANPRHPCGAIAWEGLWM